MFKQLCGEDFYDHVSLATTMWENLDSIDTGNGRKVELIMNYWGAMCRRGTKVVRHQTDDRISALRIVDRFVQLRTKKALAIQREMVDQRMPLIETSAGQVVQAELQEAIQKHKYQLQDLQETYEQALRDRDADLATEICRVSEVVHQTTV